MMCGHGGNPILFDRRKKTFRTLANPHSLRSITSHFFSLTLPPPPIPHPPHPRTGRHICITPYLKSIQKKYINQMKQPLSSADMGIFSPKISKYCYINEYRYRLHFDA